MSAPSSRWRDDPYLGFKACALIILTIVVPAIITLWSINVARPKMTLVKGTPLSPYGYTSSLTLFTIPVLVLGTWFLRHPRLDFQRRAFWRTLACLVPMGFLLDLLWGCTFFTFLNRDAVIGIWVPAVGGEVPFEEFVFYTFGFLAVLMTYIWMDEYWLRAYHIDQHRIKVRSIPRVFQFHIGPILIGLTLFGLGWAYKRFVSDHPAGLPWYFIFELAAGVLPPMVLYRTAAPFINWRALTFTYFLLLLISLLWEATVAFPYQWWGYNDPLMIGIFIAAWSKLPIEEPLLWSAVTIATVVFFEATKVFLAMNRSSSEALFGRRRSHKEAPSTSASSDPDADSERNRRRRRLRQPI